MLAALLGGLCGTAPVRADERCAAIAGGSARLAAIDAGERLRFVEGALEHGARRARQWAWGWAGIYSAIATYNFARLADADEAGRIDYLVGGSASLVGVATLAIHPLGVMRDQRRLERHERAGWPAEPGVCARLAFAEHLLLRDAASEKLGVSALTHAGSFLFNAGLSLLLGVVFGHWSQAAITGFTGLAVGELQIATQPVDVVHALTRYRDGQLVQPTGWLRGFALAPLLSPNRAGIALSLTF